MKNLEIDNRIYEDTKGIADSLEEESLRVHLEKLKSRGDEDFQKRAQLLHPPQGKKFYLEITVENSLYAGALYNWLYGKSKSDGKSPLLVMGCELHAIHFSIPGLSEEAKEAIRRLNLELDNLEGK